jgi:hypothetical protein
VTITHADCHIASIVDQAHTVDTFRRLKCLQEIKTLSAVDENSPITAANKHFVPRDNTTVHLTTLDVELLQCDRLVNVENIDVVGLTVGQ